MTATGWTSVSILITRCPLAVQDTGCTAIEPSSASVSLLVPHNVIDLARGPHGRWLMVSSHMSEWWLSLLVPLFGEYS